MIRFIISTPTGMHETLKDIAQRQGQTLTGLIRQILWEWIKDNATEH